jgi:hypothetical protein
MQDFIKHFARDVDGSWRGLEAAELDSPMGRIQIAAGSRFSPGTNFMGVDLAKWLDEQYAKDQSPR